MGSAANVSRIQAPSAPVSFRPLIEVDAPTMFFPIFVQQLPSPTRAFFASRYVRFEQGDFVSLGKPIPLSDDVDRNIFAIAAANT